MLIGHVILATIAVGALALRPRSAYATLLVALAGVLDALLGAAAVSALAVIAPLVAFLAAALTLATLVERSGLADRTASALAASARGSSIVLYVLVCALCALFTAAVSLDGAVVLMIPLLVILARRFGAPFGPLFLGAVVVANAASIAVPQGNPTNLVIISRLGLLGRGLPRAHARTRDRRRRDLRRRRRAQRATGTHRPATHRHPPANAALEHRTTRGDLAHAPGVTSPPDGV